MIFNKSNTCGILKIGFGICGDWFGGPKLDNSWPNAQNLYKKTTL